MGSSFCAVPNYFATRRENIAILRSELHATKVKAAMDRRRTKLDSPDIS